MTGANLSVPSQAGEAHGHSPRWQVHSLGQVGQFFKGGGGTKADTAEDGVACVRYGDLYTTYECVIRAPASRITPEAAPEYTPLEPGDVLFAASGETLEEIGKSAVNLLAEPAVCGGDVIVLRARETADPHFLGYATNSAPSVAQKAQMGRGITVMHIYPSSLKRLILPLPPRTEQAIIAAFLDRETARIDALVEKKQRLLELLDEKRTALISRAVTKGLDPDVPMKGSGVPWLGEVPEHWERRRLKFLAHFVTSGSRGWAAHYSDEGAIFLRIGNLRTASIELDLSNVQRVSPPEGAEGTRTRVETGDVLVSITALIGAIARVGDEVGDAYVNQHLALVRCRRAVVDSTYVAYALISQDGQEQFRRFLYGGTKDGLGLQDVREVSVLLPPPEEQQAIVAHLDAETARIDTLNAKVQCAIELLKEYRTALITAAVTGQIDVSDT